jgi:branched-chain amino acid transport system permease protein
LTPRQFDRAALLTGAAAAILALTLPFWVETFTLINLNVYVILSILALSMAWVWGVGGVLSFGQSVFFGLGAYTYAVGALNLGGSSSALLLAAIVPAAAAGALGYFLFYGRISDVYLAVITLTVSLILFHLINTVAGSGFAIASTALGGYNGIPGIPALNAPWDASRQLSYEEAYVFSVVTLLAIYALLRWLLASRFGQAVVAIRENELRAELLGYDSRAYKLGVFVLGALIAGLAGALYAAWGSFIGPGVFGISFAAQIIIWAQVGGVATLAGPILGCLLIQALTTWLGETRLASADLVLGGVFVLSVLLLPAGLLPRLRSLLVRTGRGDG